MTKDDLKTLVTMPMRDKLLVNEPIKTGESMLAWLHKFQGQIDHRPQVFFNTFESIKNPNIARFYVEEVRENKVTSDSPATYLNLTINIPEEFKGRYMTTVSGIVGSPSSGTSIVVSCKNGNENILPSDIVLRSPSSECRVPFSLKRVIEIDQPKIDISVELACSKGTFTKGEATGYFCSIELVKVV